MSEEDEEWELTPENAHPRAAERLKEEFFWDGTDENSPFGNDTGADTLSFYVEWREENPGGDPLIFLMQLLDVWEAADSDWDAVSPDAVRELIRQDKFSFDVRDETIIALAFGQFALEGEIHPEVKRKALLALERQALPLLIFRWRDPEERAERLRKMQEILVKL